MSDLSTKVFDFTDENHQRRFGTAKVTAASPGGDTGADGYRLSNGGYTLEVIDSNYYSPGDVITVSRGAVRHFLNDIVTGTRR